MVVRVRVVLVLVVRGRVVVVVVVVTAAALAVAGLQTHQLSVSQLFPHTSPCRSADGI